MLQYIVDCRMKKQIFYFVFWNETTFWFAILTIHAVALG